MLPEFIFTHISGALQSAINSSRKVWSLLVLSLLWHVHIVPQKGPGDKPWPG
jgi:hypothetical protein